MPDTPSEPASPSGAGEDELSDGPRRSFIEQARRAQIVAAAIETIAEEGYAKATMARIAARAGISPGLISYHFAGKDELMGQVLADVEAAMDQAITANTDQAASYSAALRGLIETQVHYFVSHPTEVVALGEIFNHAGAGTPAARATASSRVRTLQELEGLFAEAQEHGEFASFAPRVMAVTLLAALEAVPGELLARPDGDVGAYGRELADLFERATKRRRGRGRSR